MVAMDCRSSVGMPKTMNLAVDWHHNESPPCGRSAVAAEERAAPFAVNIRREFEKCKPESNDRVNCEDRAFCGTDEASDGKRPE
jgi:hypothetical protein